MRPNLVPDIALAERLFDALHAAGFDGVGITRAAYGPGEQQAHDMIRAEAMALDLEVAVDAAGNLLATLPGTDRSLPRVVLGSHLDSVASGGNFDGAAGVLAGLATLAGMRHAGWRPARDVTLAAVRAEESGAWFPTAFPGSKAALGVLPPEALEVARLDTGRSLASHMAEAGFDPDAVRAGACLLPPARIAAYVELHIEQGPVLDTLGIPVGIVTAIPGSRRLRAGRVLGQTNHSGATPRAWRHDAGIALAEFAVAVDAAWLALEQQGHSLVCTFCQLHTDGDSGFGKVSGSARFELDVRSPDPATLDALYAALDAAAGRIAARRGVRFDLGPRSGSSATPMDAGLRGELARTAQSLGIAWHEMPSGGGHDAVAFAQAGVPSAMLFVRNQGGSHTPHEAMRMIDFATATTLLCEWTRRHAG